MGTGVRVPRSGVDSPFVASRVAYRTGHATGSFGMGVVHGFTGVHPLSQAGRRRADDESTPGERRSGDRRSVERSSGGHSAEQLLAERPTHDVPRVQVSRNSEMGAGAAAAPGGGPSPIYNVRAGGPNSFPRDRAYDSARTGFTGNYFPASAEDMAGPYGRRLGQPSGPRTGTLVRRPPIAL